MNFFEFKEQLDAGVRHKVYVFVGPERAVLLQYVKKICENPIKADSVESIAKRASTKGLFSKKETFVIEDDKWASEKEMSELRTIAGKDTTLILIYPSEDNRKKLFKNNPAVVTFDKFESHNLVFFVRKFIPDVTDELAMLIAHYCGNDVGRIENESQKLSMLGEEVTEQLVRELVHPPVEDRIFDMMDMIAKKNKSLVFDIYYDLLELKTSPVQIVSLLYTKFKQVLLVQSYMNLDNKAIAGKTGLTFYQVNLSRNLVGSFTAEDLIYFMQKIQKIDEGIKSGQVEQFVATQNLLVQILR